MRKIFTWYAVYYVFLMTPSAATMATRALAMVAVFLTTNSASCGTELEQHKPWSNGIKPHRTDNKLTDDWLSTQRSLPEL